MDGDLVQHAWRLELFPIAIAHRDPLDPVQNAHPYPPRRAETLLQQSTRVEKSSENDVRQDSWKSYRYGKQT